MKYSDELTKAMKLLAERSDVVFLGQSVSYSGNSVFTTLKDIPGERKIELPVIEDAQMGMSIGMALAGLLPVSIYPRMDFLILACNQLVNHLDKIESMSQGRFRPKVIIRTSKGAEQPLYSGEQHIQDHTEALRLLAPHVDVVKLTRPGQIVPAYVAALSSPRSTILVEIIEFYDMVE